MTTVQLEHDDGVEADWMAQGNCWDMDPAIFFPIDGAGVQVAQEICVTCPVKGLCLEYALANRIAYGVWRATSERERRRIIRHRSVSGRQPAHV